LDIVGTYKIALTDDYQKYWETDDIPIHSNCDTITQKKFALYHHPPLVKSKSGAGVVLIHVVLIKRQMANGQLVI
jgi:hypothetical protein